MDKVSELVKAGKIKEIADMRDETDLTGLEAGHRPEAGTDPDKLMAKLFRMTPLMDSQSCNFNILIAGMPRVMGVREILEEWTAWRSGLGPPPGVLQHEEEAGQAALAAIFAAHPAGHRPGHPDHPGDRGGRRGGPQPDDRLRDRPGPGGVCSRHPPAQHQQGVHPEAHPGGGLPWRRRSRSFRPRSTTRSASGRSSSAN